MNKRILELDGLRACAVIAVFLHHAFHVRMLWMGVDLFFVLSGFLITGILIDMKDRDLRGYFAHFYGRRVRRILPPYVLILIVGSLLFGLSWTQRWYLYFGLTNYALVVPGYEFLPFDPLWSLGVEEQFYLIWPLFVFFLPQKRLPWVLIGMICLAPIFRVLAMPMQEAHWIAYEATPCRMDTLAMGALLTLVWRRHSATMKRFGFLGLVPVALAPIVMMLLSKVGGFSTTDNTVQSNTITYWIALLAVTGAFLWALGGRYTGILRVMPLQWLGRISYSFYLVHLSLLLVAQQHIASRYVAASIAFAASVAYALTSWFVLEKPLLHGGNRRVAHTEAAAARAQ